MALEPSAEGDSCGDRNLRPRNGLSGVFVEAAAGLPAKTPGLDVLPEERRRRVPIVTEALLQDLHDGDARVEADQVGECERAHRMRETEPRDRVDRLRLGNALL